MPETFFRQSMFALLADLMNDRGGEMRCATKESLQGVPDRFLTIAAQNLDETCKEALVGKVMGAIRASVSAVRACRRHCW
jgi:ethanolamine transporter EutH